VSLQCWGWPLNWSPHLPCRYFHLKWTSLLPIIQGCSHSVLHYWDFSRQLTVWSANRVTHFGRENFLYWTIFHILIRLQTRNHPSICIKYQEGQSITFRIQHYFCRIVDPTVYVSSALELLELTALLHLVNSILAEKNLYSVLMFFLLSQKFCSCVLVPTVSIFLCCIGLQISITSFLW